MSSLEKTNAMRGSLAVNHDDIFAFVVGFNEISFGSAFFTGVVSDWLFLTFANGNKAVR